MTVILQRPVRCNGCDRLTGATFDQPADQAPLPVPWVLCDNCNIDKLPAPSSEYGTYQEDDVFNEVDEPDSQEEPHCLDCGSGRFEVRWSGSGSTIQLWSGDNYWREDCGCFHVESPIPEDIANRRTLYDGRLMQAEQGASTQCADCGHGQYVEWTVG